VGALFLGVFSFTQQYAPLAVAESLPGVDLASWLAAWTNLPGIAITITFVFQLFPDGRPPSPRWRPVVWLTAAATVVPTAVLAARAWPVRGPALAVESFEHPALATPSRPASSSSWPSRSSPWPPWSSGSGARPAPSASRSSGSPTEP
jgi:hypothetical protein